ncbi:lipoprotein insertase outer membrane protein LolB [Aquabacterium sp. OR-4]|uniref:lipoprotein insertase outer membrane protein LolB n=1 Tax=Aquabacterium sp. OR-4 TaxID=2978127 RepID=UPI0021B42632|nr:lipoprotein insertase outer membrane protein LolB [Aquabacterium sp. OR-4]MDT7837299.1 lipoprotein insertase outer membrane protein LolB [Aquabacterium sp. OR-4]
MAGFALRRRRHWLAAVLAAPLALLLGACATPAVPQAGVLPVLEGRLALRVDGQPERDLSAGFELSGNAERGALLLQGPLGATAARASWSPAGALLRTSDGEQAFATLDALATQALGENFPIAALFDWLRGQPWPGANSTPRADGGAGFVQLGWQVSLARLAEGWLEARRDGPPAVSVRVRLTPGG